MTGSCSTQCSNKSHAFGWGLGNPISAPESVPGSWLRRANWAKVGQTLAPVRDLCKNSAPKTHYANPFFAKTAKSCGRCHSFSRWLVDIDSAFVRVALTPLAFYVGYQHGYVACKRRWHSIHTIKMQVFWHVLGTELRQIVCWPCSALCIFRNKNAGLWHIGGAMLRRAARSYVSVPIINTFSQ